MEYEDKEVGPPQITVYYDGDCSLCRVIVSGVSDSKNAELFSMKDIALGNLPTGVTREQASREVHVVDSTGRTHKNIDALFVILETYPYAKLFTWLGKIPPIKYILRTLYQFIANNRHHLFGKIER